MTDETTVPDDEAVDAAPDAAPVHEDEVLAAVATAAPSASFGVSPAGIDTAHVDREEYVAAVAAAKDAGFQMFTDLCAVDHLRRRRDRFEVIVQLVSLTLRRRLAVHVAIPGGDPSVPTITPIYQGANFYEREAYDLFGIVFDGHPDLTRLLLPDDWEGHPMRKDHPVGAVPVQFKGANKVT
ncbi:MAG: NADH-quinone oxidoreductase subunit C [Acidimicrobiia bacterium]|nr:NADH-quinone oxidoreductase subunit C [Acidimicrobiia bacterium]